MHDKQVRRRRAVLALLVVVSLILLTAYFGESPNSPLHSVQRGIVEVLSPIQEGASKALKPVRDVAGWFSDTLHAKSQRDQLRKENQTLRVELARLRPPRSENAQLRAEVELDNIRLDRLLQPGRRARDRPRSDPLVRDGRGRQGLGRTASRWTIR